MAPANTKNAPTAWSIAAIEATAVEDAFNHPLRALGVALRGIRIKGPMAPDIPLDMQRPAEYVFSRHVEQKLAEIGEAEGSGKHLPAAE